MLPVEPPGAPRSWPPPLPLRAGAAAGRALDAQRVGGAEHPGGEGVGAVGGVDGGQLGAVDLRRLAGDVGGDAHVPWVEHDDPTSATEGVAHLAGEGPGAGRGVHRVGQHDDLRVAPVGLQLRRDAIEVGEVLIGHGPVLERDVVRAQVARRGVDALRLADRRRQHHCCQGRGCRCDHAEAGHVLRLLPSSGQEPNASRRALPPRTRGVGGWAYVLRAGDDGPRALGCTCVTNGRSPLAGPGGRWIDTLRYTMPDSEGTACGHGSGHQERHRRRRFGSDGARRGRGHRR